MTTTPMSNDEIVENLKTMVFGVQAFMRFNAKERETLDRAWNLIDRYDERLKADMMTTLTKIKKEIHEIPTTPNTSKGFKLGQATAYYKCEFFIEQKINELREGEL